MVLALDVVFHFDGRHQAQDFGRRSDGPKLSLKALKWSMSVSISDSASFLATASAIGFSRVTSKNFRLASWVSGSVRLSGTDYRFEVLLQCR